MLHVPGRKTAFMQAHVAWKQSLDASIVLEAGHSDVQGTLPTRKILGVCKGNESLSY